MLQEALFLPLLDGTRLFVYANELKPEFSSKHLDGNLADLTQKIVTHFGIILFAAADFV
jgi:hypothetical protein